LLLPALLLLSWQMYRSFPVRKVAGLFLIPCGVLADIVY
jgi:hypothetical protein